MITLRNISKEFKPDGKHIITPVRNISLNIQKGELIIIIGRSGSGKTTLLNLTAGLVRPTQGQVFVDNTDLGAMTDDELSTLRSQKMGFIFQFPSLFPNLTVLENVILPTVFVSKVEKNVTQKATSLLISLGLKEKSGVFPKQLSAGEQKRVVIARALINHPSIILADEPTSDLDGQTEREIMKILKDINASGVTFLMVTHNLQLQSYASRTFRLEDGALNRCG